MEERIAVGFGWSCAPDAYQAGQEAVQSALAGSGGEADIAFVFATVDYEPDRLLAGVNERLGVIPVHGGTSFTGLLSPAGYLSSPSGVVGVLTFSTPYILFGMGYAALDDDPVAAGQTAAEMSLKGPDVPGGLPDAVLMTASPGYEEAIMRGITQVLGEDVPIIGGSVADNTVEGKWRVFADKKALPSGVVVTVLFSDLPLGYAYGSGYRPTDKKATVTRAAGRVVYELDGKRAVDVYAAWTGQDPRALTGMNILGASLLSPVAVLDRESKFCLVKHPGIVQDDGSVALFAEVREGDELVLMESSVDDLLGAVSPTIQSALDMAKLEKEEVAALLLIHCGGRRAALGDRIGGVVNCVQHTIGGGPFLGYLTFGEQGCLESGRSVHCDLLLSALVIGK